MVRSVSLLRRLRLGSWRNTQASSASSLSLALDNSGTFDNVTAEADLMTVPSNVSAAVSQENMEQCMTEVLQEMSEDKKVKRCVESGKYSDEELSKLQELATATAGIKCFVNMFQESCNNFVGEQIHQALYLNTFAG